jgi:hypothetical protein
MTEQPFTSAIFQGDAQELIQQIKQNPQLARDRNEQLLALLLEAGAEVNHPSQNPMHVFPLHSAAAHHDPHAATRMVQALLKAGAAPNVREQGWSTGNVLWYNGIGECRNAAPAQMRCRLVEAQRCPSSRY